MRKGNYLEIQNSSIIDVEHFTLCAKFKTIRLATYSINTKSNYGAVLSFGNNFSWNFGAVKQEDVSYQPGDYFKKVLQNKYLAGGVYDARNKEFSYFSMWDLGVWNRFCLQRVKSNMILYINEKEVQKTLNFDKERIAGNIRLMNLYIDENKSYPMQGSVTDLQIWDRILMPSENETDGNILSWKDIYLTNQTGVTIYEAESNDKYSIEIFNLKSGKNIIEALFFCMNKGKEMAVIRNKKMLGEIRNRREGFVMEEVEDENDYYFFAGYVKYLNKWINIITRQELDGNEFEIEGVFKIFLLATYKDKPWIYIVN